MSSRIGLYSGKGADPFFLNTLERQLNDFLDPRFHCIDKIDFSQPLDPSSIGGIVVGGGSAGEISEATPPQVKSSLLELFNKHHRPYFGICAGGVIASDACYETMRDQDPNQLKCMRMEPGKYFGVFPGKTVCPIFPKPQIGQNEDGWYVPLLSTVDFRQLSICTAKTANQLLSAQVQSPGYLDVAQIPGAEILSTYESVTTIRFAPVNGNPGSILDPATISESLFYQSQDAKMVLTGSHYEVDSKAVRTDLFRKTFRATPKEQEEIAKKMEPEDPNRQDLFRQNLEKLGLHCRV